MRASIFFLPILLSLPLQAQTPFAPVGAKWTYTQSSCCGPDSNVAVLQALSDTVIQGRTCSHVTTSEGWFGCYEVLHFYSISNDSMYYFNEDVQQYNLLFRWNAVPGDTWSTPISQGSFNDTLDWSVTDTGHVNIGGASLRTLLTNQIWRQGILVCPMDGLITEQLGGSTPFTWVYAACDGEGYNGLRCYDENIFPMPEPPPPPPISWLNPLYPQCALSTGVHEMDSSEGFSIDASSVLAGQPFTINVRHGANDAHVRILDTGGRIVSDRAIDVQEIFSLPRAGMYLVQLFGNDQPTMTQRLTVQ